MQTALCAWLRLERNAQRRDGGKRASGAAPNPQRRPRRAAARLGAALGLGFWALHLLGCAVPPLHEGLRAYNEDCRPQTAQPGRVPPLRSLFSRGQWEQRQAWQEALYAPIPRADLHALAIDLRPHLDRIGPVPPMAYPEGAEATFWVADPFGASSWPIQAELLRLSDASYVWAESGAGADEDYLRRLGAQFDQAVHAPAQRLLNVPSLAGIDQDPRVHLLFARRLGAALGYFSSASSVSRAALAQSNEKDMLVLNLDAVGDVDRDLALLAHEYQHLVHWFRDPSEREFVNEGLSELAPPLLLGAFTPASLARWEAYRRQPDVQLNAWASESAQRQKHYGAAFGFALYVTELFGPSFARRWIAEPLPGIAGLEALLERQGCAFAFDDVFADFAAANLAMRPEAWGAAGRLGYQTLSRTAGIAPRRPPAAWQEGRAFRGTLAPYAVQYLALPARADAPLTLEFQGSPDMPLAAYAGDVPTGPMMWSHRRNGSLTRLQRTFDLRALEPDAEVWLETRMAWDIETHWDYGYLAASRDGAHWELLESAATSAADPFGASLGPGLTGVSREDGAHPSLRVDRWDLASYAGDALHLRFDYVTDGAQTRTGWWIDRLAIDAIGYAEDFSDLSDAWIRAGWTQIRGPVPVTWLVQMLRLDQRDGSVRGLQRFLTDAEGVLTAPMPGFRPQEALYLIVSPLASGPTMPASYEIRIRRDAGG